MNFKALLTLFAISLMVTACGEDTTDPPAGNEPEEENLDEEGCEHMIEGPSNAVTAGADAASAVDATGEHTRFDIAFVDVEGGKGGVVTYAAAEEGDYVIFLDKDVAFTITDAGGTALEIEASEAVDLCAEVAVKHTVEMEVGLHTIAFAGGEEASVSIVIEAAGHDEEQDEENDEEHDE